MKVHLTRRYTFSASHRLYSPVLSAEANREAYGKCNNPHGHGHNYHLEVTVSGPISPETGMVCDLTVLDAVVSREVLDRFAHANLNLLQEFASEVPTTENLVCQINRILSRSPLPAHLEGVRIEETSNNSFECLAPAAGAPAVGAYPS
jgi:6-pyruvoyltetrahydropterin/6-carboxytetrahydropterin synthase